MLKLEVYNGQFLWRSTRDLQRDTIFPPACFDSYSFPLAFPSYRLFFSATSKPDFGMYKPEYVPKMANEQGSNRHFMNEDAFRVR